MIRVIATIVDRGQRSSDYGFLAGDKLHLGAISGDTRIAVPCPCGRRVILRGVEGRFSPRHVCNAKCMNSSGPSCECSCGGRNHGRSFG